MPASNHWHARSATPSSYNNALNPTRQKSDSCAKSGTSKGASHPAPRISAGPGTAGYGLLCGHDALCGPKTMPGSLGVRRRLPGRFRPSSRDYSRCPIRNSIGRNVLLTFHHLVRSAVQRRAAESTRRCNDDLFLPSAALRSRKGESTAFVDLSHDPTTKFPFQKIQLAYRHRRGRLCLLGLGRV